ncbi:hypothetical protein [Maritimibacter sp. HL-12]|jgi:hypothetical protein|uniref:hypothetical protein n=1 Tax=Maritimibacter sp. HL-12 TaxID=1162418 RepID=UPI000A0F1D49|nr:hypothetical protein [Maritimibacter sp. HL-12]SMH57977.1 hypothetical protein SAMN05661107_3505 [Maritimibacter sp. HL-12]
MRAALFVLAIAPGLAFATPYDGLYRPNYDFAATWDCTDVGMEGGALAIEGDRLFGVENICELAEPVELRGMNAVLYDATCDGEGTRYEERVMLMAHDFGVYVIRDGQVADWLSCDATP